MINKRVPGDTWLKSFNVGKDIDISNLWSLAGRTIKEQYNIICKGIKAD